MNNSKWNHNIHYYRTVTEALRGIKGSVLDVGCGDGILTAQLVANGFHATGLDSYPDCVTSAQSQYPNVDFVLGDFLQPSFASCSFDAVVSVATFHHFDMYQALQVAQNLLKPGGRLVIVGLARSELPRDLLWEAFAAVYTRILKLTRTYWEHNAPIVWPPPLTYREVHRLTRKALTGSHYRRLALWRYVVTWDKPIH